MRSATPMRTVLAMLFACAAAACTAPHPDVSDAPAYGRDILEVHLVVAADSCVDASAAFGRLIPGMVGPLPAGIETWRSTADTTASTFTFYGPDADVMWESVRSQLRDVAFAAGSTLYLRRDGPGSAGVKSDLTTTDPSVLRCTSSTRAPATSRR